MEWIPLEPSQNDLDFTEYQKYIAWKIAGIFGLSLQDLGVEMESSVVVPEKSEDRYGK